MRTLRCEGEPGPGPGRWDREAEGSERLLGGRTDGDLGVAGLGKRAQGSGAETLAQHRVTAADARGLRALGLAASQSWVTLDETSSF